MYWIDKETLRTFSYFNTINLLLKFNLLVGSVEFASENFCIVLRETFLFLEVGLCFIPNKTTGRVSGTIQT